MAQDMFLPCRLPEEAHGAWYRRCAERWLERYADTDPEHAAEVRRLSRRRREAALAHA